MEVVDVIAGTGPMTSGHRYLSGDNQIHLFSTTDSEPPQREGAPRVLYS